MNLEPTWLFLSLIPGGIGFVLFTYGRKQDRLPQLIAGIALIVYPYFTSSIAALVGVGVAICGATWLAVRSGW